LWSIIFGVVLGGALLLFIVAPFIRGWWLPKQVSVSGDGVDALYYLILGITGFFYVLVEVILVVALWRYPHDPGRKSHYVHGHHRLEMVWTFVPGVILLVLAIIQNPKWAEIKYPKAMEEAADTPQQIEVTARQWEWRLRYPSLERLQTWEKDRSLAKDFAENAHVDDVHLANELHVWKSTPEQIQRVLVHLRTQDVIHSFFLPNLRLKQDALPGKTIPVWFAIKATDFNTRYDPATDRWVDGYDPATGSFGVSGQIWELACAEFCGTRHSLMRGKLYVHENEADFKKWLEYAEFQQFYPSRPKPKPPTTAGR
jgi:cytochrome c oxidase subunit 2